jgi:hypothetical protein
MQPEAGPNKIYKARQKRKGALEVQSALQLQLYQILGSTGVFCEVSPAIYVHWLGIGTILIGLQPVMQLCLFLQTEYKALTRNAARGRSKQDH